MTRKLRKGLAVFLGLTMMTSVITACGGNDEDDEHETETQIVSEEEKPQKKTEDESEEDEREHVTIRFAQFGNNADDIEGMENDPVKQEIEEKVNISLEYDTGTEGFDERMQNELFTGGAADLFPTWGETDKLRDWVDEELVYCLSDIVNASPERYPTLNKIMHSDEYKMYNELYTGDAEKAYAIYGIAAFAEPTFAGIPAYNTAILEEVNDGEVPQTVEEFIDFTIKCAESGYVGWWPRNDKLTNWNQIDKTIAGPQGTTILPPKGDFWEGFVPTGEIGTENEHWTLVATSDESKEVMKQLNEMYAAGGLDSGIGVKSDFDDAYAAFGDGRIASMDFGFGYPAQYKDFYLNPWEASNSDAKPEDLTLGVAPTHNGEHAKTYTTGTWVGSHYFIPTNCEFPERVLDLVEFIASPEGQDLMHNTVNGEYQEGREDYWEKATAPYGYGDGRCKYVWFSYMLSGTEYQVDFKNNEWWEAVSNPIDHSSHWATEQDVELMDYARDIVSEFRDDCVVTLPAYYNLVSLPAEANDIRTRLVDTTNEYLSQMLGGQLDIDEGWEEYVSEYERLGANDLEQMVNDAVKEARELYGN